MKNLLKLFIVLTCATSLQAGGKYAPQQQKDELIATYEIFFKYDLRNGEKDAIGKIRNRLYLTRLDASGAQLNRYVIDEADEKYKRKIPDNPSTKLKISFIVRKSERWVLLEVYSKEHLDEPAFIAERCLWGRLEKELLELFDAGEVLKLYRKTKRFDANLGFFTENNIAEYRKDGKPSYKEFISVRTGKKETTFEKYDDSGRLNSRTYQLGGDPLLFEFFYPSGKLKSVIDQRQTIGKPLNEAVKIQKEFNEKGELVKEVVTDAKAGAATTKFYGENGEIIKTETKNLR
ncbi:hypothetical protein [uncultured Campylobacter sp.]|uniref:hypothetical protein n=1 Tax=uncultured Campylobacter sp. TaxID=218934 RepID=UPI0028E679D5|nr:hypothetical protein [uncultured Campylobacter sp.]